MRCFIYLFTNNAGLCDIGLGLHQPWGKCVGTSPQTGLFHTIPKNKIKVAFLNPWPTIGLGMPAISNRRPIYFSICFHFRYWKRRIFDNRMNGSVKWEIFLNVRRTLDKFLIENQTSNNFLTENLNWTECLIWQKLGMIYGYISNFSFFYRPPGANENTERWKNWHPDFSLLMFSTIFFAVQRLIK